MLNGCSKLNVKKAAVQIFMCYEQLSMEWFYILVQNDTKSLQDSLIHNLINFSATALV